MCKILGLWRIKNSKHWRNFIQVTDMGLKGTVKHESRLFGFLLSSSELHPRIFTNDLRRCNNCIWREGN